MQNASSNSSIEGVRTSRDNRRGFNGISPSSKSAVMYVLSVSLLIPGLKACASAADPYAILGTTFEPDKAHAGT